MSPHLDEPRDRGLIIGELAAESVDARSRPFGVGREATPRSRGGDGNRGIESIGRRRGEEVATRYSGVVGMAPSLTFVALAVSVRSRIGVAAAQTHRDRRPIKGAPQPPADSITARLPHVAELEGADWRRPRVVEWRRVRRRGGRSGGRCRCRRLAGGPLPRAVRVVVAPLGPPSVVVPAGRPGHESVWPPGLKNGEVIGLTGCGRTMQRGGLQGWPRAHADGSLR